MYRAWPRPDDFAMTTPLGDAFDQVVGDLPDAPVDVRLRLPGTAAIEVVAPERTGLVTVLGLARVEIAVVLACPRLGAVVGTHHHAHQGTPHPHRLLDDVVGEDHGCAAELGLAATSSVGALASAKLTPAPLPPGGPPPPPPLPPRP